MTTSGSLSTTKVILVYLGLYSLENLHESIVYNITHHTDGHPGGLPVLLDVAGQDATVAFEEAGHSLEAREMLAPLCIGSLAEEVTPLSFSACHR